MKAPVTPAKANTESMDAPEVEFSGKKMSAPAFSLTATPPPDPQNNAPQLQASGTFGIPEVAAAQLAQPENDAPLVPAVPVNNAPPAQPAAPAPAPAPVIAIQTTLNAADASGKNRRRVGVGEEVTFTSTIAGDWTASAGDPAVSAAAATTFVWRAPNRAANATIAVRTAAGASANVVMDVLEPTSITTQKISELAYPEREAGAGMRLHFDYHPMSVSFGNVEAGEKGGNASNITGWCAERPLIELYHGSLDEFIAINSSNRLAGTDKASISGIPKPWTDGGYDWVIPNRFRVAGEAGLGKEFTNMTQTFRFKADGEVTVTKGGSSVTRRP